MSREPFAPVRVPPKRDEEFEARALRVRYRPEPAYSLFGRLAARNDEHSSCRAFGTEVGLRYFGEVLSGRRIEAVKNLAGLRDADVEAHTAVKSADNGPVALAGETLLSRSWAPEKRRYCPHCLRSDLKGTVTADGPRPFRPYRRAWWDVKLIDNCPIHSCELLGTCPICGRSLNANDPWPWRCRCGGDLTRAVPADRAPTDCALDRYVVGRLGGCTPTPFAVLDPMPLDVAVRAAFYVGWIADHGQRLDLRKADRQSAAAARCRGLELLADWPRSVEALLDRMVADLPARDRRDLSARTAYGALSRWLVSSNEPSLDPMREVVRDHADKTRQAGQSGLTLTAAALEARIARPKYFEIAKLHGLVPSDSTPLSRLLLDGEAVSKMRELLFDTLSQRHAARLLGISVPAFERLVDAGLIVVRGPLMASRRDRAYSRRELASLVNRLAGDAPERAAPAGDEAGIPSASFKAKIGMDRLMPLLLDGRIRPRGRLQGTPGLHGVLVSVGDLLALHGQPADSMLLDVAAKRFGISYWGFRGLVKAGLVPATQVLGRTNKQWWMRNDDFARFCGEYGTIRHLAERYDLSRPVTRQIVKKVGVRHAPIPRGHFVEVYRYREVEEALTNSEDARAHRALRKRRPAKRSG